MSRRGPEKFGDYGPAGSKREALQSMLGPARQQHSRHYCTGPLFNNSVMKGFPPQHLGATPRVTTLARPVGTTLQQHGQLTSADTGPASPGEVM
ncbi:hypothetical protein J6590_055365 [Homalodisca vitripennis]|nr:hypothetical protein J6590_055365 [Homalodisca vitripennis]